MGSWRFDSDPVSEQDRSKFIADAAKSMSNDIPSNAPPAWLQNKLCDVLFRDYIPGGSTNLPGHGDFEEAAKVLSKYLLSAMGNKIGVTQDVSRLSYSQKSILAREHEVSFYFYFIDFFIILLLLFSPFVTRGFSLILLSQSSIEHQTVELLKSYLEESQSPYTVDREKANRQIFADLLKITTEDKIQAFGNELKRHDYFARNNAVAAIQKLKEQGVFDDKLEMDFRKVLKSDTEC